MDAPSEKTSKKYHSKIGQEIIKGTNNKQTVIWEVPLETRQSGVVENKIIAQTTKPELAQYLHAAIFGPATASLLKSIKKVT